MTVDLSAIAKRTPRSSGLGIGAAGTYLLVFGIALVVGLAMVFVGFHAQSLVDTKFDPYDFGAMGKSLAEGPGFAPFGNLIERRAPLYPLMIGGIYSLFGEQSTLVLVVQAVLLAITCVLVFDTGRRLFNTRTGFIAATLCACNPMLLRYVGDLQLETLLTLLFTLTLWSTVRFYTQPSVKLGLLLGASAALAAPTFAVPRSAIDAPASAAWTASFVRRCTSTISPPISLV